MRNRLRQYVSCQLGQPLAGKACRRSWHWVGLGDAGFVRLQNSWAAIFIMLSLFSTPCLGQDNGFHGLLSDLEGLENRMQVHADPSVSMVQRISNLEIRLF